MDPFKYSALPQETTLSTLPTQTPEVQTINTMPQGQGMTLANPTLSPAIGNNIFSYGYSQQATDPYGIKAYTNLLEQQQNSWQNQYLSPTLKGISAIGGLANIWMGYQNYKIAKEQLGMAKEQWAETKKEADRIKGVRQKLTQAYMS